MRASDRASRVLISNVPAGGVCVMKDEIKPQIGGIIKPADATETAGDGATSGTVPTVALRYFRHWGRMCA